MSTLKKIKNEYVSLPDVAELKGVSRQAVWQAVVAGRLRAEKFGRDYLVRRIDAENWEPRVNDGAEN